MQSFQNLDVWRRAHQLTLHVYRATKSFPDEERFGVTSQLHRACVSIAANIAEGCGRQSDSDFRRFLHIAMGSASESEYLVILSRDLEFLQPDDAENLLMEVRRIKRMIASLIKRLMAPPVPKSRART